ncbi:hypothetical protein HPP92_024914 [Vanilla planifolia]|uniref:Bet v I/Major latex protein domain-containing protein n=1 Tax=Vanilla planifolia TaxID=51239 RepID=A0A835UA45_VANPL|nr:hypothetical protein HPP92_025197 [Vanilla planifolia]KAG0453610.1 hypothetical protein HPP92_024914 [Vanilla planifolia]
MTSSWTVEIETQVPADRLFKAACVEWHNIGPKLFPGVISDVVLVSGSGGPGSIRQINYAPGSPCPLVKERLEFLDHDKLETELFLLEGGDLGKYLKSARTHFKVEPKGSGSVLKVVENYEPLPEAAGSDDYIKQEKEGIVGMIKATEAFLLANPDAFV